MNLSKLAAVLSLSVALAASLAAAPQATKTTPPAKAPAADKASPAPKKGAANMVNASDLPKAVSDAVKKAHPNGTIASATKSMRGSDTVYSVKVTDAGKTSTIMLKEDGTSASAGKGKGKGK